MGVGEAGEVCIEIEQCEAVSWRRGELAVVSWRRGSVGGEVGQL